MIQSFADKRTAAVFDGRHVTSLPSSIQTTARRKLRMLDSASSLDDLRVPPGNRLESLAGRRRGGFSIRIDDQWRICFAWDGRDAHDVTIIDCH